MKKLFLCLALFLGTNSVFAQKSSLVLPDRLTLSLSPTVNTIYFDGKGDGPHFDLAGIGLTYEKMLRNNLSIVAGLKYFRMLNYDYYYGDGFRPADFFRYYLPSINKHDPYNHYLSLSLGFKIYDLRGLAPFFLDVGAAPVTDISLDKDNGSNAGYFSAYLGFGIIFKYSKRLLGTIEPIYYYPLTPFEGRQYFSSFTMDIGIGMKI